MPVKPLQYAAISAPDKIATKGVHTDLSRRNIIMAGKNTQPRTPQSARLRNCLRESRESTIHVPAMPAEQATRMYKAEVKSRTLKESVWV